MIIVVLDTNAVHRDPWMTRGAASRLVELAASGVCEIAYPWVVIRELQRQRIEDARRAHDSAAVSLAQMSTAGVVVDGTTSLLAAAHEHLESDIDEAFTAVLTKSGIHALSVPDVKATDLLDRDLGRRRPFLEIEQGKTKKSLGFRDVLIWESVLALLQTSGATDVVLFVTFDNGFLADDQKFLHPHLVDDLDQRGIERTRIRWSRNIPEAITTVEALKLSAPVDGSVPAEGGVDEERTPVPDEDATDLEHPVYVAVEELKSMRSIAPRARLVKVATDALFGLMYDDSPEDLTPAGLEDAVITDLEQRTEFSFDEDHTSPDVVRGTAEVVVTVEGAVHRGDQMTVEDGVSIIGHLNNRYLEGSAEFEAQVVVELDIEAGDVTVIEAFLEEVPPPPHNRDNMLDLDFTTVPDERATPLS